MLSGGRMAPEPYGAEVMIGICTDSNAQLPAELAERYGIEVVPLTVVVDEREYLEGLDLDVDEFYALYAGGRVPSVEFIQPSSGQFAVAYDDLVERGCTQILSIHTSASKSDTLKAARLAAHTASVPVRLVDSHSARFGVSCCVWATADAVAAGASLEEAAGVAEALAPSIATVFLVGGLDLAAHDTAIGSESQCCTARARSIFTLDRGRSAPIAEVDNLVEAVNAMASCTLRQSASAGESGVNVAVGSAHQSLSPVAHALADALEASAQVRDVVRFRIGPSIGVESGPGTVACVSYPV